jgi:hypothetical protein
LLSEADKNIAYQGLAWLLDALQVKADLIRRPFESELRRNVIDASRNYFEQWLLSDDCRVWWSLGVWKATTMIRQQYLEWCEEQGFDKRFTASPLNKYLDHACAGGFLRKDGDSQGRMTYEEVHGEEKRGRGWTLIQRPDDPTVWSGPCALENQHRTASVSSITSFRERLRARKTKQVAVENDLATAFFSEVKMRGVAA